MELGAGIVEHKAWNVEVRFKIESCHLQINEGNNKEKFEFNFTGYN